MPGYHHRFYSYCETVVNSVHATRFIKKILHLSFSERKNQSIQIWHTITKKATSAMHVKSSKTLTLCAQIPQICTKADKVLVMRPQQDIESEPSIFAALSSVSQQTFLHSSSRCARHGQRSTLPLDYPQQLIVKYCIQNSACLLSGTKGLLSYPHVLHCSKPYVCLRLRGTIRKDRERTVRLVNFIPSKVYQHDLARRSCASKATCAITTA